jgi:hypothetical protein
LENLAEKSGLPANMTSRWLKSFPDLIDAGVIPDPFVGQKEKLVQWVVKPTGSSLLNLTTKVVVSSMPTRQEFRENDSYII